MTWHLICTMYVHQRADREGRFIDKICKVIGQARVAILKEEATMMTDNTMYICFNINIVWTRMQSSESSLYRGFLDTFKVSGTRDQKMY